MQDRYNPDNVQETVDKIKSSTKEPKPVAEPKTSMQPTQKLEPQTKLGDPVKNLGVIANTESDKVEQLPAPKRKHRAKHEPATLPISVEVPVVPRKITIPVAKPNPPIYDEVQELSEDKIIHFTKGRQIYQF